MGELVESGDGFGVGDRNGGSLEIGASGRNVVEEFGIGMVMRESEIDMPAARVELGEPASGN